MNGTAIVVPVRGPKYQGERIGASRITDARIFVHGGHSAGYYIGIVARGESGRQVTGGPEVPGPWAYMSMHCVCISAHPGGSTRDDIEREMAAGLTFNAALGDVLDIDGDLYRIEQHNPWGTRRIEHLKLVPVAQECAK